jgi:hypothetical protein
LYWQRKGDKWIAPRLAHIVTVSSHAPRDISRPSLKPRIVEAHLVNNALVVTYGIRASRPAGRLTGEPIAGKPFSSSSPSTPSPRKRRPPGGRTSRHPEADTNKDGQLSWPELQAHRKKEKPE